MVREVLTGANGLATGVSYMDKQDLQEFQVNTEIVILRASTGESALLLNSKPVNRSNGLANSSGVVGKCLHDSTGASLGGSLPQLMDRKRYNEAGWAACTSTRRGGWTTRSWISRVVTTLSTAAGCPCRPRALARVPRT